MSALVRDGRYALGTTLIKGVDMFVTMVEGEVQRERETDLLSAWNAKSEVLPEGLIESSLLRGDGGRWRIVTVWESREAVVAMRASGEPPAAPAMFETAGSVPQLSMWTVEGRARST